MFAADAFPRSNYITNEGPFIICGRNGREGEFRLFEHQQLTITVEDGTPRVHMEKYVAGPSARLRPWL